MSRSERPVVEEKRDQVSTVPGSKRKNVENMARLNLVQRFRPVASVEKISQHKRVRFTAGAILTVNGLVEAVESSH